MYIKKAAAKLFKELDDNLVIPKGFNKFVDKITKNHNLIIKIGTGRYRCTYCNYEFFGENKRIDKKIKCPNCKQNLITKSKILKHFDFGDSVGIIDRYDDYWVVRYFEILSTYDGEKFNTDTCEYGRKIYNYDFRELHEIINDHVFSRIGCTTVRHDGYMLTSNWRYFSSYWKGIGDKLIFYPGNMKSIFKGTEYQYSQVWNLAKHEGYFSIRDILYMYSPTVEFLIKLKLYNLIGKSYFDGKTFKERFGVDKKFLKFMQRHNITYEELEILKYYQKENIKTIRYFANLNIYEIVRFNVDLDILKNETKISRNSIYEYNDYLRIAKLLEYDMKDKSVLYPSNINEAHDRVVKLYETNKSKKIQNAVKKRFKELMKNSYENKRYAIFPANSVSSLEQESKQQNNCVKTYAENYAKGITDIYFMRLITDKNKSLVTVEVQNNKIVQKRTKNNQQTTKEQDKFLDMWERKILKGMKW